MDSSPAPALEGDVAEASVEEVLEAPRRAAEPVGHAFVEQPEGPADQAQVHAGHELQVEAGKDRLSLLRRLGLVQRDKRLVRLDQLDLAVVVFRLEEELRAGDLANDLLDRARQPSVIAERVERARALNSGERPIPAYDCLYGSGALRPKRACRACEIRERRDMLAEKHTPGRGAEANRRQRVTAAPLTGAYIYSGTWTSQRVFRTQDA